MKILNTRMLHQSTEINQAIIEACGIPINLPTLEIKPTPNTWLKSMPDLNSVKYAIFTSPNSVENYFIQLIKSNIQWNASIFVIAIGNATALKLYKYHIKVDLIPKKADSENLLQLSCLKNISNISIILIKGVAGRGLIENELLNRKSNLSVCEVYQTSIPEYNPQYLHELWHNNAIDLILYTSQQGMQNLFDLMGDNYTNRLCNIKSLVISPRLATIATSMGIKNIHICNYQNIISEIKGLIHDSSGEGTKTK